ncbi:MAG: DUF6273 domain-containing protein [Defluviitaleaceae bacterium]|nr:DUF6273 domain-containing protein [Defluviitaleaceae bacterium]
MRNEIREALQRCQNTFGEEAFEDRALASIIIDPVRLLITLALKIDAYSRLKNSSSRNMATDVFNLTKEMQKKYFIEENAAKMTIECIAELLGYTPPTDIPQEQPSLPEIGGVMRFGDYEWRVLDIQNDKILLLSENILEQRAYHPCYAGVTWENSKLREYLNSEFINNFDTADKARILETSLRNPENLWYGITNGNDTTDKIFILSIEEADLYFGNSGDYLNKRRKKYDNGKWISDDDGWILSNEHDSSRIAKHNGLASLWWLRSSGYSDCTAVYVSTTGNIPPNGDRVCIGRGGVRPALWIQGLQ